MQSRATLTYTQSMRLPFPAFFHGVCVQASMSLPEHTHTPRAHQIHRRINVISVQLIN